jgi:hypothetical protein
MRTLAATFGISDVALAKTCRRADIPVPARGYWNRKQASKPTIQTNLPPRFPGTSDKIDMGGGDSLSSSDPNWHEKFLQLPIPPVPTFDEEISSVTDRVQKMVGKIRCPRDFDKVHKLIAKLLEHDKERRERQLRWKSTYDPPKYEGGIERRRLLILNAIFLAAQGFECIPSMRTSKYMQDSGDNRDISVQVGCAHVHFTIEPLQSKKQLPGRQKERLRLAFGTARDHSTATKYWDDTDERYLEDNLTEIMVEILITAEISYRKSLVRHREWVIERRAEVEKEIRRRKEEEERKAHERREREAKERIDRLISQSTALHQAETIRLYVEATRNRVDEIQISEGDFEKWAAWALNEADRIDPVKNGAVDDGIQSFVKTQQEQ